ncbi:MAG: tripartite tricarboxylate transporter substrate binding protein [Alcaligenaceae bacterium]
MPHARRPRFWTLPLAYVLCLLPSLWLSNSVAQTYPSKTIRLIVPYVAGGGTDVLGRGLAQKLTEALGQPVIVENRPGADGMIGSEVVSRAAPDGYTLLFNSSSHGINPSIHPNIGFNTMRDLRCISQTATQQMILVVHPTLPVNTVKELITYAKANPNVLNFSSSSKATQLPMELFNWMAGISMTNVLYKGSGPATTDLLAGRIQTSFGGAASVVQHINAGKLRALAIGDNRRSQLTPNIPTVAEEGLPDFYSVLWSAMFAPSGTPPAVIERLNSALNGILQDPQFKAKAEQQGFETEGTTPQACDNFVQKEINKWADAIKQAGIKPE